MTGKKGCSAVLCRVVRLTARSSCDSGERVCVGWCARQRTHFLLLRQKKVSKEKASRRQGRCAVPCAARVEGATQKLALRAQTSSPLIPSPLRCSALPQRRGMKTNNQQPEARSQNNRSRYVSLVFCFRVPRRYEEASSARPSGLGARVFEAKPSLRAPRLG